MHLLPDEIYDLFRLLGKKWSVSLLHTLDHQPMGFNELKQELDGISPSVLADLLNEFIARKIVEKRMVTEQPPRYDYFVTGFGDVLCDIIDNLMSWSSGLPKNPTFVDVVHVEDGLEG